MLKFNAKACFNALENALFLAMEKAVFELYWELTSSLKTPEGKGNVIKQKSTVRAKIITGKILSGAYAIIDSYGTGSLMDKSNPFLDEYMATANWGTPMYNPIRLQRNTTAILGRSKGRYRAIIGKARTSRGSMEGLNLEKTASIVTKRGRVKASTRIALISPSKAIDTSFKWMAYTRINKIAMKTIAKFDFSRFIEVSLRR